MFPCLKSLRFNLMMLLIGKKSLVSNELVEKVQVLYKEEIFPKNT